MRALEFRQEAHDRVDKSSFLDFILKWAKRMEYHNLYTEFIIDFYKTLSAPDQEKAYYKTVEKWTEKLLELEGDNLYFGC